MGDGRAGHGSGGRCPPIVEAMTDEAAEFTCPRCGSSVHERFYGPCTPCRTALKAALAGEARDIEVEAYEPKMNVTPNAVATKE